MSGVRPPRERGTPAVTKHSESCLSVLEWCRRALESGKGSPSETAVEARGRGIPRLGRRSGRSESSVLKGLEGGIEMGVPPVLLHGAQGGPHVGRRDGHQRRGRGAGAG